MSTNRVRIEIVNSNGLHLRAAQRFVQVARRFRSEITVARDGRSADGKSILDLMMLAAAHGAGLDIDADGPDCQAAIVALSALVESGFDGLDGGVANGWGVDT